SIINRASICAARRGWIVWVDSLPAKHALLIVALATLIAFSPVLWCDFTSWDDYETVARNPLLNPPRATSLEAFWSRPHGDLYIPVTYSLWWIAAQVALPPRTPGSPLPKLNPHVFHALN